MATYSKELLSGSTDGRGILVSTASPIDGTDTTIHTTPAASEPDLVTLFVYNDDVEERELHIKWGGTTDPFIQPIAARSGLSLVTADLPLQNSEVITASASAVNVLTIYGYVNRVTA